MFTGAPVILQTVFIVWLTTCAVRGRRRLDALAVDPCPNAQVEYYFRYMRRWLVYGATACGLMWMSDVSLPLGLPRGDGHFRRVGILAAALTLSIGIAKCVPLFRDFLMWQIRTSGVASALLPRSARAAAWFVPTALTAGVFEEVVFRDLVPAWALAVSLWLDDGMGRWMPMAMSAGLFGLVHLYQGWKGVLLTGFFGALLYHLTERSGTLLPAMMIHFLVNLRFGGLYLVAVSSSSGWAPSSRRRPFG